MKVFLFGLAAVAAMDCRTGTGGAVDRQLERLRYLSRFGGAEDVPAELEDIARELHGAGWGGFTLERTRELVRDLYGEKDGGTPPEPRGQKAPVLPAKQEHCVDCLNCKVSEESIPGSILFAYCERKKKSREILDIEYWQKKKACRMFSGLNDGEDGNGG